MSHAQFPEALSFFIDRNHPDYLKRNKIVYGGRGGLIGNGGDGFNGGNGGAGGSANNGSATNGSASNGSNAAGNGGSGGSGTGGSRLVAALPDCATDIATESLVRISQPGEAFTPGLACQCGI